MSAEAARPAAPLPASLWEQGVWSEPLRRFARVTQLCVCAYDAQGRRRAGPFLNDVPGEMLAAAGLWDEAGLATEVEARLVHAVVRSGRPRRAVLSGSLVVAAMPVVAEGVRVGALSFGWVLARFADPLLCEGLARRLRLPSQAFWQMARQLPPVGRAKLQNFADLLETLMLSIVFQVTSVARLEEAARAKDTFLATVSHELRTPLTAMSLRTQGLLRSPTVVEGRDQRALAVIAASVAVQQRLIDDLLDASRTVLGKLVLDLCDCDLRDCLRAAVDVVAAAAAAKDIALHLSVPPTPVVRLADPVRLQQVFWNLMGNAIKFTPAGGSVRVRLRRRAAAIEMTVSDSGRGIEPGLLSHVFERFAQTGTVVRGPERGLGLGLAISRAIVELHGGLIGAASDGAGRGSVFTVSLPGQQPAAEAFVGAPALA